MHTNAAWDTSTNREWPSICFTKSTVSCKSWGKIWQRKPFLQHEDDSTLYIIYLYMINRTIPGFSMNYHISPSWFCLNSQGRASHYQWILWVEKNLRKDQPPSRPLCLLVPILHWREPIPPQMDVEPNISAWPQSGIGRNTEECLASFWYKENWWICPHQKGDMAKNETMFHWRRHLWDRRLQLLLKDRLAFWVAPDLIQPFISVIRERPNELLLKTRIVKRTNGWIGKHWKTTNVYKCHRNLRVPSHASPPKK